VLCSFARISGEYDALILAEVGLKRLGFADRVSQVLSSGVFGYAGTVLIAPLSSLPIHCPASDCVAPRLACSVVGMQWVRVLWAWSLVRGMTFA
jgi:hypothetical protein